MIYLTATTESQQIIIPNVYGFTAGVEAQLFILSTVDIVEWERRYQNGGSYDSRAFSSAFRIGDGSQATLTPDGRYVIFTVSFRTAPMVGSYEYRLMQGSQLVGGGCCQIGEYGEDGDIYEPDVTMYDKSIQYEQYD